uniref:Uncharacterized protein n=1 Tax=Rhizophora mucronata TaxID=61149 RepID=A0A2P2Q4Z0_RHIMU
MFCINIVPLVLAGIDNRKKHNQMKIATKALGPDNVTAVDGV